MVRTAAQALDDAENATRNLTALVAPVSEAAMRSRVSVSPAVTADATASRAVTDLAAFSRTLTRSLPPSPTTVEMRINSLLTPDQRTEFRPQIQTLLQITADYTRDPQNRNLSSFLDFALTALPQVASSPDSQLRSAFDSSLRSRSSQPFDTYVSSVRQSSQLQVDQVREIFDSALGSCERAYESTSSGDLRAAITNLRTNIESLNARLSNGEVPSEETLRDLNSKRSLLGHISPNLSQNQTLFLSRALNSTDQSRFSLNVFLFENSSLLSHSLLETFIQNQGDSSTSFSQIVSDFHHSLSRLPLDQNQINSLAQNPNLETATRLCAMRRIQEETPRSQEIFAPLFAAISTISPDKISSLVELSHLYSVSSSSLKLQIRSFLSRPVNSSIDTFVTLLQNHHSISHLIPREQNSSLINAYRQVLGATDRFIFAFSQDQPIDQSQLNNSLVSSSLICQNGSSLTSSLLASTLRPNSIQSYLSSIASIPSTLASVRGRLRNEVASNYARLLLSLTQAPANTIALESVIIPLLRVQALSTSVDVAGSRLELARSQPFSDSECRSALLRFEGLNAARRITTSSSRRTYLSYLGAAISALRSGDSTGSDAISRILSLYSTAYNQRNFDLLRRIELGTVPNFNLPTLSAILSSQSTNPPSSFSSLLARLNPNESPNSGSQFIAFRDSNQLRRTELPPNTFALAGFELCVANLQLSLQEQENESRTASVSHASSAYARERSRLSHLDSSTYSTLNSNLLAPGFLRQSLENSSLGLRAAQIHLARSRNLFNAANTLSGSDYTQAVSHCTSVYGVADTETVRGHLLNLANSELRRAQLISDAATNQSDSIFTIHRSATTLHFGASRHAGRLSLLRAAQNFNQIWNVVDNSSFDLDSEPQRRLLAVVTQTASSSFNFGQAQYSRSRSLQSAITRILSLTQNVQTQLNTARENTASSDGSSATFWRYGGFTDGSHQIQATDLALLDYSLDENLQNAQTLARRGNVSAATALLNRTSTTIDLRLSRFDVIANHQRFFGSPQSLSTSTTGYLVPSISQEQFDTVSYLSDLDRAESLVRLGRIPHARILLDGVARNSAIGSRRQELLSLARIASQSASQFEAQARSLSSLLLSPNQNAQNADEARAYLQNARRARDDSHVSQMADVLVASANQARSQAQALDSAMRSTTSIRNLPDSDLAYSLVEALASAGHTGRLDPSTYATSMRDLANLTRNNPSPNRIMGYLFEHPQLMQEGLTLLESEISPSALESLRAELNFHRSLPGYSSLSRRAMVVSDMAQREFAALCDIDSLAVSGRIDSQTTSVLRDNSSRFGSLGALAASDPASFSRSLTNGTFASSLFEATLNHADALQSVVLGRSGDLSPHEQALSVARTNTQLRMASYGFVRESTGPGYSPLVLDSNRAQSLFSLVSQSDSTINQFANVSLSLSGAFSAVNLGGAAQSVSTSQRTGAYRAISLANSATDDSFRLLLNPSFRNPSSQLSSFAQIHHANLESSTRAIEIGARRERNFHRATTFAEMVGAGVLSPVFSLPVAVYFGVSAIGGFAEQIRGARGYHNLSTLERALGIGGIALAGLGFFAHGTGTLATELNAELAAAREINPLLGESRLLRGVGITNAALGATTLLGGVALGGGSVYEMYLRDPSANAFDYALAIWQAAMPGFRAALAPGVGRYNPFRGIISPSLLHGESIGARAYRTGMFLAFGATRGQLIEEYNASVSASNHAVLSALTPAQRETLQNAVEYASRTGANVSPSLIFTAAEFYRRNPNSSDSDLANIIVNLSHDSTIATNSLTQRGHSTLDRLEFVLGRQLTAQEHLYAVDQVIRSPTQSPDIPTLVQNLSNPSNLPELNLQPGIRSESPTSRPPPSSLRINDLSDPESLRDTASRIGQEDPWTRELSLSRLPPEIREPLEFLINNPSFIADPAGFTPQSRMAVEGTRRRIESATSSLSSASRQLNVIPTETDIILHIATRENAESSPENSVRQNDPYSQNQRPTAQNFFPRDRAIYLLGSMLADDTSFVTAQRSGDTRTMRQIAERYSSRIHSAEALVDLVQSRTPHAQNEFYSGMESIVHGSRVSVDSNGVAHEEVSIGRGEHTVWVSRSQFRDAADLAFDAAQYVCSSGDENSIPQSRRNPQRVAQVRAFADLSFSNDLFAMRSTDRHESQSASDRILVRALDSLGFLPQVNLGVEDSALSSIAADSSLEFSGVQRRSNSEPRVIFVDPVTDERFAIPAISPSSLTHGQTLADAYRDSVNLHTGATRARNLGEGRLAPSSDEDLFAQHLYQTQQTSLNRPLTDSESRQVWRDATDAVALIDGARQRASGSITDFDLSPTVQNFGRMSPSARELVLNDIGQMVQVANAEYRAISADPNQSAAATAALETFQNSAHVYRWLHGASTLLGEVGQRLESAYGLPAGSTASYYLAGTDLTSARNAFYSRFGITNPALGHEDVFFAMATSSFGNLLASLRNMNPDSTDLGVRILGGMTGAYEVSVTNADGSTHVVYAKRFDMRPDAEGARNYNRAGVFASNCVTNEPYRARDFEALFVHGQHSPPTDPHEVSVIEQMRSFMRERNLNPNDSEHIRIAATAVADTVGGMFYDAGDGWTRYGFSNSIRDERLDMHTHDPNVTVSASVVGAVELWNISAMPFFLNIFNNHRQEFWRELGYLFGAEGALTSFDGHEQNVWALRVRVDDPSPTNLESLGYHYATDASGNRTIERIPGREQPYFLSLEHDLNGNEVIDGFRLGRIDTDDAAGAFMVDGYSSQRYSTNALTNQLLRYNLSIDRLFVSLAEIHNHSHGTSLTPADMLGEAFGTGGSGPAVQGIRTWAQQHLPNGQFASSVEAGIRANAGNPTGISFHLSSDSMRPQAQQFDQHGIAYAYLPANGEGRLPIAGVDGRAIQSTTYELLDVSTSPPLQHLFPLNQTVYVIPADASLGLPILRSTNHEFSVVSNLGSIPEALRSSAVSVVRTIGPNHTDTTPNYFIRADSGLGALTGLPTGEVGALPTFRWLVNRGEDGLVNFWEGVRSGLANTYATTPRPNP